MLKSLCEDSEAAALFALFLAKKAQQQLKASSYLAPEKKQQYQRLASKAVREENVQMTDETLCDETLCDESPGDQVRQLYSQLALHPQQDFGWLKGKENAKNLGYDQKWLDQVPEAVWESAAAVGNPFSIGPIHLGETVVDLGCGVGADLWIAASMVGNTGRVVGIDLTPAMVEKARSSLALMNLANGQVELGDFLNLPLEDSSVDVAISNGSLNLSPKQACVFREIVRVLKPNGRLYLADMIRLDNPPTAKCGQESPTQSWANCVAGTVTKDCLEKLLVDAGFQDVAFIETTGYHTSPETEGALFRARSAGSKQTRLVASTASAMIASIRGYLASVSSGIQSRRGPGAITSVVPSRVHATSFCRRSSGVAKMRLPGSRSDSARQGKRKP